MFATNTYLVVSFILGVEGAGSDMMPLIPHVIDKASIICVILHNLVLGDALS